MSTLSLNRILYEGLEYNFAAVWGASQTFLGVAQHRMLAKATKNLLFGSCWCLS